MKKLKVAFTGVFDLANYGDHLFPEVFDREMKKRGIECDVVLFSIYRCQQAFNKDKDVYSIYELEKMHKECNFDAIIVGGGDIVHYELYQHAIKGEYKNYPIYDLWIIPSIFSYRNNVKLIWNAVGIPFDFNGSRAILTKALVEQVDYISVRNKQSADALVQSDLKEDRVFVVPDTALLLDNTYKKNTDFSMDLKKEKYVVIHLSKLMPEKDKEKVFNEISALYNRGYKIVLLPLAYTNGDDINLKKISEECNVPCITFVERLSLEEIITIIAGCEMYIGVSFHGAITAYCFGKKAIAYNYTKNRKTKDLFALFDRAEYYLEKGDELEKVVQYALTDNRIFNEKISIIQLEIKQHFDHISEKLVHDGSKELESKFDLYKLFSSLIGQSSLERQDTAAQIKTMQKGWQDCNEKLEQANMGWKNCATLLQNEQKAHRELYENDLKIREELEQLKSRYEQCMSEKKIVEEEKKILKEKLDRKWWKR